MNKKLYVGNIPYQIDKDQLINIFSSYGSVIYIKFPRNKNSSKHRGYAFIEMATDQQAEEALNNLNRSSIMDRNLIVSPAVHNKNDNYNKAIFLGNGNCLFCSSYSQLFGFNKNIKGICPECITGLKKAIISHQKIESSY